MHMRRFGPVVPSDADRPQRLSGQNQPFSDVVRIPTRVPFPVPPANVYLFLGAEPAVVDTGTGTDEGWQDLVAGLKAHDLTPGDVKRVLVSHHHIDHAGNAKRLRDAGAEVCVHEADAPPVAKWQEVAPERNRAYGKGLRRAGVPKEILKRIDRRGQEVDAYMASCPVDRELREGDKVRAGERELSVYHTPGHTAGSALYVDEKEPLAATGDTLLERITPNALTVRREDAGALGTYLQTLKRLQKEDLGVVLPGHGVPFMGAKGVIDRAFVLYEERREKILGILHKEPEGLSVWGLVERLWSDTSRGSAFLMVSEVLGHLELLVGDDEATLGQRDDTPVLVYRAT